MNIRIIAITSAAVLGAFFAGKYLFPNVKTEVKTVVKTIEVEKIIERKNVNKKETKTEKPDGTVITETQVTEVTESTQDKSTQVVAETVKSSGSNSGLTLGVLALKNVERFSDKLEYGVTVTAPLIGRLKVQALGTTDKRVGVGVALEF